MLQSRHVVWMHHHSHVARRYVANDSKTWEKKYKRTTRIELEKYWKKVFQDQQKHRTSSAFENSEKKKFYCLSMFPYPSGRLHMGHVRVYTISDAFARFYRMNGYNVIHPMGWDAFGLPADNAARDRGLDPAQWTTSNISYMRKQFDQLNLTFDWEREFATCDPEYYKWTQYLFVKLFEAGLAYQKEALVNWDPVDQTVLADEQVDENGCSWRSGALVEGKYLKQWFFKTTDYAKSLHDSLDEIDENVGIKGMQRHWIGEIDGCVLNFPLHTGETETPFMLPVFCSHPEAVHGSSHVIIQSSFTDQLAHQIGECCADSLKSQLLNLKDEGVLENCFVLNTFTGQKLQLVVVDGYQEKYKRVVCLLGLPDVDDKAKTVAEKYKFLYDTVFDGDLIVNSQEYSGLTQAEAREKILHDSKKLGLSSGKMSSSKLCDWLISRQRYWGTPIPIIHCPTHGCVPVPYDELPVKLPELTKLDGSTGISPLSAVTSWVNTTCPKCGEPSVRETDTMDTFVDSSWYYLRYTDPKNNQVPFSKTKSDKTMPVDLYIGGKEHAILHLYFARFFSHFLADKNMHSHREPFKKILAQGIIKGLTHQIQSTGKYIHSSDIDYSTGKPVVRETGEEVEASYQKMSKSKLNGIDPEDFVNEWGISITRLYVLYAAAPFEDIHWDVKTDVIPGVMRWQLKVWTCVSRLLDARRKVPQADVEAKSIPIALLDDIENLSHFTNKTITDVTNHFTKDCVLSAAITCLMTLAKKLIHTGEDIVQLSPEFERAVCAMTIMSAPLVPHFSSELWAGLQQMEHKLTDQKWGQPVLDQEWPKPDAKSNINLKEYKVMVDRRTCHAIRLPTDFDPDDIGAQVKASLLKHKKVKKNLKGATPTEFHINKDMSFINIITKSSMKTAKPA